MKPVDVAPTAVDGRALGQRGALTRQRLIEAAEQVFAQVGYHDASIVKITEAAGVAMGTFYLYFRGKKEIFDELLRDLNRRVRHAMSEASSQGGTRLEQEVLGFKAFFRFTAEHPGAVPRDPPGGVRLARNAALPLREALERLHRGAPRGGRARRGGGDRPGGQRLGADGGRRADRDALDPVGAARTRCRRDVLDELERIIACVLETPR